MDTETARDELTDEIALIEMQRQEMQKEAGVAAACNSALRKLHELLEHEKKALQLHGPETGHPANVEAVTIEIERVKGLAGAVGKNSFPKGARTEQGQATGQRRSWQNNAPRNPPRNKGRRTMGRASGRG